MLCDLIIMWMWTTYHPYIFRKGYSLNPKARILKIQVNQLLQLYLVHSNLILVTQPSLFFGLAVELFSMP